MKVLKSFFLILTNQIDFIMITDPDWLKSKEKSYFHQITRACIEKLVDCIEKFNKGRIDADTSFKK